ncbi:hypothetical protein QWY85_16620 [Neolewinella lacunae]|uniref:Uncharacterized protein n=1 Tax=Neolewinella lacunae TaxID=1517758 RepID=A0A923TC81_9BACT|nr:hypothetical protein [Neolewinella lacunae]MBC6993432.1 hypothetical protein [Neolewinella lacunae]MDN3636292.1 hypothetical protein [Neolewinella lacunae]
MTIFWKYYFDCTFFNLLFGIVVYLLSGFVWALILCATLGNLVGFLCFGYLKGEQYSLYFNLGYTKRFLFLTMSLVNGVAGATALLLYLILS